MVFDEISDYLAQFSISAGEGFIKRLLLSFCISVSHTPLSVSGLMGLMDEQDYIFPLNQNIFHC